MLKEGTLPDGFTVKKRKLVKGIKKKSRRCPRPPSRAATHAECASEQQPQRRPGAPTSAQLCVRALHNGGIGERDESHARTHVEFGGQHPDAVALDDQVLDEFETVELMRHPWFETRQRAEQPNDILVGGVAGVADPGLVGVRSITSSEFSARTGSVPSRTPRLQGRDHRLDCLDSGVLAQRHQRVVVGQGEVDVVGVQTGKRFVRLELEDPHFDVGVTDGELFDDR